MRVDDGSLCAIVPNCLVDAQRSGVGSAEGGERIEREADADVRSSSSVKSGVAPNSVRLARTGTRSAFRESAVLFELAHGFREDHVGAGFDAGGGAVERSLQPFAARGRRCGP